jgi:hypothetical protein
MLGIGKGHWSERENGVLAKSFNSRFRPTLICKVALDATSRNSPCDIQLPIYRDAKSAYRYRASVSELTLAVGQCAPWERPHFSMSSLR